MTTIHDRPPSGKASAEPADLTGRRPEIGAWAYFEGQIVPIGQATVSIATHALNYGTAVFEGIRAYRQEDGGSARCSDPSTTSA